MLNRGRVAITQQDPDNDEDEDRSETSAAEFFGSVACDNRSEEIIHKYEEFASSPTNQCQPTIHAGSVECYEGSEFRQR